MNPLKKCLNIYIVLALLSGCISHAAMYRVTGLELQSFVPSQGSEDIAQNDRKWCCGPNSGARALAMLSEGVCVRFDKDDQAFMHGAPATIGHRTTTFIQKAQATLLATLAGLPLWKFGATKLALLWVSLVTAGVTTPWWLKSIAPVGPHPAALASYLQEHVRNYRVSDLYFDSFEPTLKAIRESVLHDNTPVIAHLCFGAFALHYVNIVGFDDLDQKVEVLDTDGALYEMSFARLAKLMRTEVFGLNPVLFANFNLITFNHS